MKTKSFKTQQELELWLAKNHAKVDELWIRMFKKSTGIKSIDWDGALEVALCYGWIDGIRKSFDEVSFIQRFTPRRAKSNWSKRNTEIVARLIKEKRMKSGGITQVEAARADGRWERAYDSSKNMKLPEDFLSELDKNKKAKKFFDTLSKNNLFAIYSRLHSAKTEKTRTRKMNEILEMLSKEEKFY